MTSFDLGLLLVRGPLGLLLAAHGLQKLFGWFGGAGLVPTADMFAGMGYRNGKLMAALAGLGEVAAGLGLALGLFTPLAGAAAIGVMVNAAAAHWPAGLWSYNGGYEYPLVVATMAGGLAWHGPGTISVDALAGFAHPGPWWGIGAIAAGLVSATAVLASRRKPSPVATASASH